jgi:hypothetical protein
MAAHAVARGLFMSRDKNKLKYLAGDGKTPSGVTGSCVSSISRKELERKRRWTSSQSLQRKSALWN